MIDLALDGRIFLTDEFDLALQEIDMLFNTSNTELIGYTDYGLNLESFLWTLTPTTTELNKYIRNKIDVYCPLSKKFNVSVNTEYLRGTYRSIYLISISLTNENGITTTRKYQYK